MLYPAFISGNFRFFQRACFFSLNSDLLVSRIILCFFFAVCSSASVLASSPGTLVFISILMFELQCVEMYFVVYSNVLQYITMYFIVHLTALYIHISFLALDLPFIYSLDIKLFVFICIWICLFMYYNIAFYKL